MNAKKKTLTIVSMSVLAVAMGVAFLGPLNTTDLLFRARASNITEGTISFSGSNAIRSGTTNTTNCTSRAGGNIICKTYDNDTSKSSGKVGALKNGSIMRFYESDGITEFTFQDLEKISISKVSESNSTFGFTINALYDTGETFTNSYTLAAFSSGKTYSFSTLGNVSNIWIECTSDSGQIACLTEIVITYNCSSKHLSGVSILNQPSKTIYEEGDKFDPAGMIVAALYSDDSTVATNSYTYYPSGYLSTSDNAINVYIGGFFTSLPIVVNALPELTGIYVETAPSKTSYYVGDYFNSTGMVINGTFSDGIDREIHDYTFTPSGQLTTSDTEVIISYGGFSTTQSISVTENTYAGTYSYTSASFVYTLVINNDGTGLYTFVNSSYGYNKSMHFTWVVTGTETKTITFTKDAKSGDSQMSTGSYYDLFTTEGSYNSTNSATITDTKIILYTCSNSLRTSTAKNLTK